MRQFRSIFLSTSVYIAVFIFLIFVVMSLIETRSSFGAFSGNFTTDSANYLIIFINILIFLMSLLLVPYLISSILMIFLISIEKSSAAISEQKVTVWVVSLLFLSFLLYFASHFFQFNYLLNSNCMCMYSNSALIFALLESTQDMSEFELSLHQYHIEMLRGDAYEKGALGVLSTVLDLFVYLFLSFLYFPAVSVGYVVSLIDADFFIDYQMQYMSFEDFFDFQKLFVLYGNADFFFDDMMFDNLRTLSQSNLEPELDRIVMFWQFVRAVIFAFFLALWRISRRSDS